MISGVLGAKGQLIIMFESIVFWVVAPYSVVVGHQYFIETCHLCLQDWSARCHPTWCSNSENHELHLHHHENFKSWIRYHYGQATCTSTLKLEAACPSKSLISSHHITWWNNSKNHYFPLHHCENLISLCLLNFVTLLMPCCRRMAQPISVMLFDVPIC